MMVLMPWIRRGVVDPLRVLRNGSPRLRYLREIEKTQYLPESKLRQIQEERLAELLQFVWHENAFYRKRFEQTGTTLKEALATDGLLRLPVLTKAEIRKSTPDMISRGYDVTNLQHAKTGGSTGKALELYFTEECSELRNACALRHDRWTGWEPGEPIAACWGNPHLPKTAKDRLMQWLLQPMMFLDTMSVNEASIKEFVRKWRRMKPTLLFGHAHSLFILAQQLKAMGIDELHPKAILSTSMMLIPSERKAIEEVFGVKVIDRYGCEEVGLIGCECERHEGMHLNIEHLIIEFLRDDGTPAQFGEPGRIVVTDLMNRAMPLIRYQVEDMGVPTDRKCSCGRGLPLMESVAGRVADFLVKPDGTKVAGVSLIENTLTEIIGIRQMQIVQEAIDHIILKIVKDDDYSKETSDKIYGYFRSLFGSQVKLDIDVVTALKQETSGKYRFSICKVR
jgi:phenylacetate-CoA ligase